MNSGIKSVLLYCKYIAKIAQIFAPVRIIAVMFTFSFGSAFATVSWTGEATSKTLNEAGDYNLDGNSTIVSGQTKGTKGITEAYRAALTKEAKAELKLVKTGGVFYAPEKAKAVAAVEAYIEALKTVKTAADAAKLKATLVNEVGVYNAGTDTITDTNSTLKLKTTVRNATFDALAPSSGSAPAEANSTIDITRIVERLTADTTAQDTLYLPGYAEFTKADNVKNTPASAPTPAKDELKIKVGGDDNVTLGEIFNQTNYEAGGDTPRNPLVVAVVDWFMDNDYRELAELQSGTKAFASALVLKNDAYRKTVNDEFEAIRKEIYAYVDKAADARRGLPISDLEGVDALVKKIKDFKGKYDGISGYDLNSAEAQFKLAIKGATKEDASLAANYFDQYYSEVAAVPEVKKLTDADKATVIALYKKIVALEDAYTTTWNYVEGVDANYAYDFAKLVKPAYEHFLKEDVKAYQKLDSFDAYTVVGSGADARAYFDASEKNVNALKARRAAYDALVANYGYSDLEKVGSYKTVDAEATTTSVTAAADEALILAAEHNQGADADYDVKDTKKLQAYLNNATLKVTTKALGNNKIRVNARFDAETYKDIVAECGNDYTISYKFYHKTAKATAFKGPKEKDRNYITYTKLSLKKGVKYKFQCGVVIKDAQGNVVAEKSYKASTTGSRVCR